MRKSLLLVCVITLSLKGCLQGEQSISSSGLEPSAESASSSSEEILFETPEPQTQDTSAIPAHSVALTLTGASQDMCVQVLYFNASRHSPNGACYSSTDEQILVDHASVAQALAQNQSTTFLTTLEEGDYEVVVIGKAKGGASCPNRLNYQGGDLLVLARDFGFVSEASTRIVNVDDQSVESIDECENL